MSWEYFGSRNELVLLKSLKFLAFSDGLKKVLGFGYSELIGVSNGSQYGNKEDDQKVIGLIEALPPNFENLNKTEEINQKILKAVESSSDLHHVLDLLIEQLTYFLIANEQTRILFENPDSSEEDKKRVESWRNDDDLFEGQEKALGKLSEKLNIDSELLECFTFDEIKDALNGSKPDLEEIKKRKDGVWSLVLKGGEIKLYLEDLSPVKEEIEKLNEIKGKSVLEMEQKITGVVGEDIMVTSMTHPDMVGEMKKMKAIITDEGGVLSHAAITCREFNIPGIIGTKVATKVLKDGMKIELDTGAGVVKILG